MKRNLPVYFSMDWLHLPLLEEDLYFLPGKVELAELSPDVLLVHHELHIVAGLCGVHEILVVAQPQKYFAQDSCRHVCQTVGAVFDWLWGGRRFDGLGFNREKN